MPKLEKRCNCANCRAKTDAEFYAIIEALGWQYDETLQAWIRPAA